jgi:FG-GAP-like repeat
MAPGTWFPAAGSGVTKTVPGVVALLATLSGCGPGMRAPGGTGGGSGSGETTASETAASAGSMGSAADMGSGHVLCVAEYCFERIDLREIASPSQVAAGNVDDDPAFEVCGYSRSSDASGSLPPEAWAVDWSGGRPLVLPLRGPEVAEVQAPQYAAPSPIDGVPQFYANGGAYVIEGGALAIREHPRPPIDGFPVPSVGFSGPVDVDGDGRHEVIGYENKSNLYGYTGYVIRYDGDERSVSGPPLPTRKSWVNQTPRDLAVAAGDFDGDGRDEIVVFDDLDVSIAAPSVYDPALNHVVTLRFTDGGYEELWRAPAGLFATELALHDLNGDGEPDLLVGGEGGIALAAGLGGGQFDEPALLDLAPYGTGGRPQWVYGTAAGDFDGDGQLELVAALSLAETNAQTGDLVVIERPLGGPSVRPLLTEAVRAAGYASGWATLAAGDFDGNGVDDVVFMADDGEDDFLAALVFSQE